MKAIKHSQQLLKVRIWRGKKEAQFVTYQVPARENQTVLDVVSEVQRLHEPGLSYRFACRVGVCGSCAMMVNGKPRWTCRTHVNKVIDEDILTIEPLRNLPHIKDLVCDMAPFIDTWQKAGAPFSGTQTRSQPPARIDP
ncbi:MAG: 2Fe-2S iron-sulfur cluster-binding protein, partial [Gammaproteobacteria bacterium]|nr:2Fe-2S iron-sulfur cluster-binding protein [Gammaproteobacteria bacterium]